jgi:hypothetical protein
MLSNVVYDFLPAQQIFGVGGREDEVLVVPLAYYYLGAPCRDHCAGTAPRRTRRASPF